MDSRVLQTCFEEALLQKEQMLGVQAQSYQCYLPLSSPPLRLSLSSLVPNTLKYKLRTNRNVLRIKYIA